jgi:hypothetical protein
VANFKPLAPLQPQPRFLQPELIPATAGYFAGPGQGVLAFTGAPVGLLLSQGFNVGPGQIVFTGTQVTLSLGIVAGFNVGPGVLTFFGATIGLGTQAVIPPPVVPTITPFAPALSELGLDAWERCGKQAGEITVTMIASMRRSMNLVLARWSNRGVNLWTVTSNTIVLLPGVATYALPMTMIDMLDTYVRTTYGGGSTDITMTPMSRETYSELPYKAQPGRPIMYWFDRTITPSVTVWPVPDTTTPYSLVYYAFNQVGDMDPGMGNLFSSAMPYRFTEAYTAAVAAHLAIKWSPERAVILDGYAKETWDEASDEDREKTTTTVIPDWSGLYT